MGTRDGALPAERSGALDLFRAVWACGIIHFHLGETYRSLAYGALPAFLIVLLQLSQNAAARQAFPVFARKRAVRLLVPWVVWSAIYGLVLIAANRDAGVFSWFKPNMLLYGTSIHLWFLPAAFALSCVFVPLVRLKARAPVAAMIVAAIGAAGALALMVAHLDPGLVTPVNQLRFAFPSVFLAVLLPSVVPQRDVLEGSPGNFERRRRLSYAGVAISAALLAAALALTDTSETGLIDAEAMTYVVGVASVLLVRCVRIPSTALVRALGSAAFLIYLIHPLLGRVIGRVINSYHSDLLSVLTMIAAVVAALAINAAFARYAGRYAWIAPYIGAEAQDFTGRAAPGGGSGH